jgi:hypothetical protein
MDVVYVFRHRQFQDLELRYSLRSVAKYLPEEIAMRNRYLEGIPITHRGDENLTQGFVFVPPLYDEIVAKTAGKTYLFFDEGAFSADMQRFLAERFPEPCVYETPVTVPESPRYDVVYLMAKSKWDQELKYSLRSLERFFPQLGKVWIVGHLPEFIDPTTVVHLPETNFLQNGVFVESTAVRLLNEQLEGLTEDFILAQDDNYLLRPATWEDFGPLLVEDLDRVQIRGTKPWQLMLWRTYDLLKSLGRTAFNY